MDTLLIYGRNGKLHASRCAGMPERIVCNGEAFTVSEEALGDYDVLLNEKRHVVGFSMGVTPNELRLYDCLMKYKEIQVHGKELRIVLASEGIASSMGIQASSWLYHAESSGETAFGLHIWVELPCMTFTVEENY